MGEGAGGGARAIERLIAPSLGTVVSGGLHAACTQGVSNIVFSRNFAGQLKSQHLHSGVSNIVFEKLYKTAKVTALAFGC